MSSANKDKQVFDLAESFLTSLTTKDGVHVTQEMLSKYFQVEKPKACPFAEKTGANVNLLVRSGDEHRADDNHRTD